MASYSKTWAPSNKVDDRVRDRDRVRVRDRVRDRDRLHRLGYTG